VTTPVQGDAVGPGTVIEASTFAVLPLGHHWDAFVLPVGKPSTVIDSVSLVEGQSSRLILGTRETSPGVAEPLFAPQLAMPASDGEYNLHVRVISAQSTILDTSGPIGIQWRPEPWGTAYVQSLQTSTTTGGYTEADRKETADIKKAVFAPLPLIGAIPSIAQVALGALVECPPSNQLVRTDPLLLTGRGTLTRPFGPIPVSAYGFTFRFEVVPAGLSVIDGVSLEYPERMAQFLAIKHDRDGLEYVSDRYSFHHDQERVCWGIPFPIRLEYSILPGVTLRFWWLLMTIAP